MLYLAQTSWPVQGREFFTEDSGLSFLYWTTELDELGHFTALRHIYNSVILHNKSYTFTLHRTLTFFAKENELAKYNTLMEYWK